MAERRYSKEDQKKMAEDFKAKANAKGADFKDIWAIAGNGSLQETVKELKKDMSYTVDQSQEQTEHNKDIAKSMNKPKE
jgi:hypothetical protein